jgi:hypothetical protein
MIGWQLFVGDKVRGRLSEADSFDRLVIRARTTSGGQRRMRVGIITTEGFGFSSSVNVEAEFKNIEIPISSLKEDSILLLPRPYPGFQPLWFKAGGTTSLKLSDIDKLEVLFTDETTTQGQTYSVEVESVWLQKRK